MGGLLPSSCIPEGPATSDGQAAGSSAHPRGGLPAEDGQTSGDAGRAPTNDGQASGDSGK